MSNTVQNNKAHAWVLPYAAQSQVAVPFSLGQELIESPTLLPIPGMATDGAGLLLWRGNWIPVICLVTLFSEKEVEVTESKHKPPYVLVLAYQHFSGEIAYGGVALTEPPVNAFVEEKDAYPLPSHVNHWCDLALSCFIHNDVPTPVIDAHTLFNHQPV